MRSILTRRRRQRNLDQLHRLTRQNLFPRLAKAKLSEVVVFSWIIYKSKADQKRIMKKVMADPRLANMMGPDKMPFDMSRMVWAGFKPIVEA